MLGSRNIRKQITLSLAPPAILKKTARKIYCFPMLKNYQMHIPRKNKEREDGDMELRS